jgi:hypothetical protein
MQVVLPEALGRSQRELALGQADALDRLKAIDAEIAALWIDP